MNDLMGYALSHAIDNMLLSTNTTLGDKWIEEIITIDNIDRKIDYRLNIVDIIISTMKDNNIIIGEHNIIYGEAETPTIEDTMQNIVNEIAMLDLFKMLVEYSYIKFYGYSHYFSRVKTKKEKIDIISEKLIPLIISGETESKLLKGKYIDSMEDIESTLIYYNTQYKDGLNDIIKMLYRNNSKQFITRDIGSLWKAYFNLTYRIKTRAKIILTFDEIVRDI